MFVDSLSENNIVEYGTRSHNNKLSLFVYLFAAQCVQAKRVRFLEELAPKPWALETEAAIATTLLSKSGFDVSPWMHR
jgi:hypothetical protein